MADALLEMIAEARRSGERITADGHIAIRAAYEPETQHLLIDLANGASARIPVHLIEGLAEAPVTARAGVEVAGIGYGLHWPVLDLDLSVPGLLAGAFGTARWMDARRAAHAGAATSPAKSAAARRNGAMGGRPRKPVA